MDKNKIENLLKELKRLKAIKDGGETAGVLFDLANKLEMIKGDKGDTPQKGVDYFTEQEINKIVSDMAKEVKRWIPKDGAKGEKGEIGKPGKDGRDGIDADETKIIKEVIKQIPIPKDGINGADGGPDLAETIVAKLESLEDDERLDVKAIKGIEELVKRLEKKIDGKVIYVGGGDRKHSKQYDLSPYLTGVLKTFSLPAFWEVTGVVCSSFPNALRPIIDYTTDAGLSQIVFTSAIDAGSTLAAGQTVIVFFDEP